jgi:hypothetical protein
MIDAKKKKKKKKCKLPDITCIYHVLIKSQEEEGSCCSI